MFQPKCRIYEVNGKRVSIGIDVIGKIMEWNTDVFRNDTDFDFKIFHALLVICIGNEAIIAGNVPDKVMKFIKGEIQQTTLLYLHAHT